MLSDLLFITMQQHAFATHSAAADTPLELACCCDASCTCTNCAVSQISSYFVHPVSMCITTYQRHLSQRQHGILLASGRGLRCLRCMVLEQQHTVVLQCWQWGSLQTNEHMSPTTTTSSNNKHLPESQDSCLIAV